MAALGAIGANASAHAGGSIIPNPGTSGAVQFGAIGSDATPVPVVLTTTIQNMRLAGTVTAAHYGASTITAIYLGTNKVLG